MTELTYVAFKPRFWKKSKGRERKPNLKTVKNKLEIITKIITRKIYGNTCYTCDKKNLVGRDWHTGHFIAKSYCGAFLKWDLRNLRPQCNRCNRHLRGNQAEFYHRLRKNEGQAYIDQLFEDKNKFVKERDYFPELLLKYESLLNGK